MKKITFQGWKNCIELTSGDFRIVVTTEVGPRVIGAFYKNSPNLFHVDAALAGRKGGDEWVNYGGHRFWHAPETRERTYVPDNTQCQVVELEDGVSFISRTEGATGMTKTLNIHPCDDGCFEVEHVLRNDGLWAVEAAPWGISVMAPGGTAEVLMNGELEGLQPTKFFSVWPYTKMNDPRVVWEEDFVNVKQDSSAGATPMKIGFNCREGIAAYSNFGVTFIKMFDYLDNEVYPDNNCNVEIYTCREMLELETLGPLTLLEPGDEVEHVERWFAADDALIEQIDDMTFDEFSDAEADCSCGHCDGEECCDDECGGECGGDDACCAQPAAPAKKSAAKKSAAKKSVAKKAPAKKAPAAGKATGKATGKTARK